MLTTVNLSCKFKLTREKRLFIARVVLLLTACLVVLQVNAVDRRAYQHGIDFVKLPDDGYRLFWSSAPGVPPAGIKKITLPGGIKCEYFTHDIYSSFIDTEKPILEYLPAISLPEAQEPVSVAISSAGNILATFEDGSESDVVQHCEGKVQQRYQLFDSSMKPLTKIKTVSTPGGHSGHVAAVGEYFVITYAEGWVDGGGVDDAGTANDIHIDVVDSQGDYVRHRGISVDKGSLREWWPLISGSASNALLIWQRFVEGKNYANLMYSVYNPLENRIVKETSLLKTKLNFYHYDVQYLHTIDRFLVLGNYLANTVLSSDSGNVPIITPSLFAYLLDSEGKVISQWDGDMSCRQCRGYHFYNLVREAQPAMLSIDESTIKVLYPVKPKGIVSLSVTPSGITTIDYLDTNHYWFPLGTDGIFLNRQRAYFVNLSPAGLKSVTIDISQ